MITSIQNSKVKEIKHLQQKSKIRKQSKSFVVEGIRLSEEVINANWEIIWGCFTEDINERGEILVNNLIKNEIEIEEVSNQVMKAMSDLESPPGILLKVKRKFLETNNDLDFILIADEIKDPGNLGTMLRSALAAGVQQVLLTEGCVDPFSPKVLRSGMGAHFRLEIVQKSISDIIEMAKRDGINIYIADGSSNNNYFDQNFVEETAIVVGSEAHGPNQIWQEQMPINMNIPMVDQSESLNAAVAASILMFEVARQRGIHK